MTRRASAVVGTGFIGPVHVEALRRLGRPVAGVLGSTPAKSRAAATALGLPKAYDQYEDILTDPDVGVIHLASPNRLHFEQCRLAITAGKHVVCEKPLAMNAAETAALVALAERAPVVTAVNYNVRFYPLNLEARQRVARGDLGRVYHVTGSYVQDWLLHDTDFNWRVLSEESGALRAVADIGTHWLDLVTAITGLEVEKVCADLATLLPMRRRPKGGVETFAGKLGGARETEEVAIATEDYGSVLLRFRGGAGGCFTVSQVTAGRKNCLRYELAGARSALAWDSERPNELWLGRRDEANQVLTRDPALLDPAVRPFANYPGGHNEGFPDTFKQLFRAVYDYIDAGDFRAPRPFPTFADGHREVALCEAILRSHREGRWVAIRMKNVEIKCRYADHDRGARLARDLGADLHGRLVQTDTYFNIRPGRLKLRHTRVGPVERYELIHYRRWNRPGAKTSRYEMLSVADGPRTLEFFAAALGVLVRVDKERIVYVKDNLRVHLDELPGLGRFLEFELIVTPAQPLEACQARMPELIRLFGIAPADLVKVSYSDLLLAANRR